MFKIYNESWNFINDSLKDEPWYNELYTKVVGLYETSIVHPNKEDLFRAFELCDFDKCKVVFLGQDPYFNEGVANGLGFWVNENIKYPPSLKNIIKELNDDILGDATPNLDNWAKQGVLLLNTILTVQDKLPKSHQDIGWQKFSDFIISYISNNKLGVAFVLWGNEAIKKEKIINKNNNHLIIKSPHPSPLSCYRGFFGSKPFSKINNFLTEKGEKTINWYL